ncbi:uncharacterized protein LOC113367862 [Ctenocephalides felis]|uniref:uncharacterized protein LOC113367862 n=1 Tax=Ctenocephalides felis TaxID=7515 RepID=UPI000E6E2D46|nr:uncharacterized protein LOC113367862 [Ctenocephalides felis]
MGLQLKLLAAAGLQGVPDPTTQYRQLVTTDQILQLVQVSVLAGERQSNAYESPTLPKRAETFGGFDNPNLRGLIKKFPQKENSSENVDGRISHKLPLDRLPWKSAVLSTVPIGVLENHDNIVNNSQETSDQNSTFSVKDINPNDSPALLSLGREQQKAAVQLSHYVYMLLCIISQQMTSINSLQAQISAYQGTGAQPGNAKYKHNDQLEELRNLQDKLTVEKEAWNRERIMQEAELKQMKQEILALQEHVKAEQEDVRQQREQLYRKMEVLSNQGLLISPSVAIPAVTPPVTQGISVVQNISMPIDDVNKQVESPESGQSGKSKSGQSGKWKSPMKPSLPLQLISATNQPKVQQQSIKQQIPLKLSHLSNSKSSASSTSSHVVTCANSSVQQMLPMKLSQTLANSSGHASDGTGSLSRRSIGGGVAYHRLSSGSPIVDAIPTGVHTRTGSSPAMMQATPSSENNSGANSPISTQNAGSKPGRTNTYPKIPEKFRTRGSQSSGAPEEEVMFF